MRDWSPSLGAIVNGSTTTFRVWAPDREHVDVVIEPRPGANPGSVRPLTRDEHGYWSAAFTDAPAGTRYRYRLDRQQASVFPDPASRRQPEGVHGPSEVIDPSPFPWTDHGWRAPLLRDLVLYELHVGTFSRAGTFRGVTPHLPHLVDLGVNAIELMPIGDFPGRWNWGYDGVAIFAPARCYGTPDDFRGLVDAAHRHGLAVYLDVVFNHFGPDGAYASVFSPYYFTHAHRTAWGDAVNLDGARSPEVRRFLIENALHWVREYHVDGLRLDATHTLHDESTPHFLAELSSAVRAHSPRPVVLIAEDHRNLAQLVLPASRGGFGLDAVWADDFHHQVRVHTAGDRESYYADYTGTIVDLATTIRQGWFFTGQWAPHRGRRRGTPPTGVAPAQCVICIQNHDQIGNRADGARLGHEVDEATYRAVSALLLLAPQTPLLFMGQEWAASSPFQFFTDHHAELGRQVTEGRRREFGEFAAFVDPDRRAAIPDPQDADTFARSRLDWSETDRGPHARAVRLYRRMLHLRRDLPALRPSSSTAIEAYALDAHTIAVRLRTAPSDVSGAAPDAGSRQSSGPRALLLVARLSGAGCVEPPAGMLHEASVLLTTEDDGFAAPRAPIQVDAGVGRIHFARPGALLMLTG